MEHQGFDECTTRYLGVKLACVDVPMIAKFGWCTIVCEQVKMISVWGLPIRSAVVGV